MERVSLRPILAPLGAALICLMAMRQAGVAGQTPLVEELAAKAVSVSSAEDAGRVDIYIERWSNDAELERLRGPLAGGDPAGLLRALQQQRQRVGVLLMPGVQGHGARVRTRTPKNLLFARAIETPNGRRVIVASDERLALGESPLDARKEVYEFNLIEIRFDADGMGVGKVATAADVVFSPATHSLEVKDYAARPARLIDVTPGKY